MITISKGANRNYLCKIIRLKNIRKHKNADRLQIVEVNYMSVITDLQASNGDVYVYFPIQSKVNENFLSATNSFRDKSKNKNQDVVGFFENHGRVKAMQLRGEKSMGYIVPYKDVYLWATGFEFQSIPEHYIDQEFDLFNGKKMVEKSVLTEQEIKKKIGYFHVDTMNLRNAPHKIELDDLITITYKMHGTSWWVSNACVGNKLNWRQRFAKKLGFNITDSQYELVYGSRRVVKSWLPPNSKQKKHFYGYDIWEDIKNEVGDCIPKGFTLYGEMVGYSNHGKMIQKDYDYGCEKGEHKLYVYRITFTNPDGIVTELSYMQIKDFCEKCGLTPVYLFYYGSVRDWLSEQYYIEGIDWREDENWREVFVKALEKHYNDKNCFMSNNKVPEEGVVIRKESMFLCEPYKLKSFNFLEWESKELDSSFIDLESQN